MGSNVKWLPSMMAVDPWISEIREIRLNYGTGCHLTIPSPALYHRISWKAERGTTTLHTPLDQAILRRVVARPSPSRLSKKKRSSIARRRASLLAVCFSYTFFIYG